MKREWNKPGYTELEMSNTEATYLGPGSDGVILDVTAPGSDVVLGHIPGGS